MIQLSPYDPQRWRASRSSRAPSRANASSMSPIPNTSRSMFRACAAQGSRNRRFRVWPGCRSAYALSTERGIGSKRQVAGRISSRRPFGSGHTNGFLDSNRTPLCTRSQSCPLRARSTGGSAAFGVHGLQVPKAGTARRFQCLMVEDGDVAAPITNDPSALQCDRGDRHSFATHT